ncbi:MAG: tRNA glutamyl-Q(34) synthetase GluQRS [Methylomarinum sp.]|nr:tRNA glutamyl-Q(34) synthetase GluQRS [Methylomarinum sp.]
MNTQYIGRFAPSPTGPLHLGSLYTALASFLDARANQGQWLLRIDDLDTCRNVAGATESIIDTLQRFNLYWDGPVHHQSNDFDSYLTVVAELEKNQLVYPCTCTRKSLAAFNSAIYPGICLVNPKNKNTEHSLRIKSTDNEIQFNDQLQGYYTHRIAQQYGDFIVKRKDSVIAYQLAVIVDDHRQNISHVIRGCDLLDSTPKQIFLQQTLGYSTPKYCHLPIITNQQGKKLSKQTHAEAVSTTNPEKTLFLLLTLLKQNPPRQLKNASIQTLLNWAIEHWQVEPLINIHAIKESK